MPRRLAWQVPAHRTWEDTEHGGVTHLGGEGYGFGPQHGPVMSRPGCRLVQRDRGKGDYSPLPVSPKGKKKFLL